MILNTVDFSTTLAFTLAAIGLLGSPGPAIAALLAVGKVHGLAPGLRFFAGLQVGLASVAALSAAGFVGLVTAFPVLRIVMTVIACAYLLYLAYKIATAPVGNDEPAADNMSKGGFAIAGAVVGITNPKAYIAFAALMSPVILVPVNAPVDALLKWIIVVAVMIVVDILWLIAGVELGRASLPPRAEQILNNLLAAMIVVAGAVLVF